MLLSLLAALDVYFITVAYYWTVAKGASVHLVFGFEYAILSTIVFNISLKYVLHAVDIGREVFWENKAVFLLHMELFIGKCDSFMFDTNFICAFHYYYFLSTYYFN